MPRRYPEELHPLLACVCTARAPLRREGEVLTCGECGLRHPVVDGVPIVLHPEKSVFQPGPIIAQHRNKPRSNRRDWVRTLQRFVPRIGSNLIAEQALDHIAQMLKPVAKPIILVVGGGEPGAGLKSLLADPRYTFVESDVYFGTRCNIIADGHDLPFQPDAFDAVICQAVLEHVIRPQACIDEMYRVLKPDGVLFIDVPFLYPVHMGAHDFTRFTLGGLRAACRWFEESEAGVSGGPGQAVAQTTFYFSRAISRSKIWSAFTIFVLPWFIFWLHHIDKLLMRKPQGSDSASGVYFLGRKSTRARTDREILQAYWGNAPKNQKRAEASAATPAMAAQPALTAMDRQQ